METLLESDTARNLFLLAVMTVVGIVLIINQFKKPKL